MQPRHASKWLDERRRHLRAPFEARLHQIDAAARRVHLLAPQHVGRAGRQAEAAVHALVDQRRIGRMDRVERDGRADPRSGGEAVTAVLVRHSARRADRTRASATRTAAGGRRAIPRRRRAPSAPADPRTMTTLPNTRRGAQLLDRRAACAAASPSMRIRPAPIAARPTKRRRAALASVRDPIERVERRGDARRQPARAHDRAGLRPRARVACAVPQRALGVAVEHVDRRRRRPSGAARACAICASTTAGSDAKRTTARKPRTAAPRLRVRGSR